jgi:DNA-binding transcriptional MerR regulator
MTQNVKITTIIVLALVILTSAGLYSLPYVTLYEIKQAVEQNNSEKLKSYIDFESVRRDLKEQIKSFLTKKMEILRAIFDQSDVGLVIAGEPKLEGMLKTYIARFANRVDFYASLKGISNKEVEDYLSSLNFSPDAIKEMTLRATNNQSGCFRLLDRTLKNIMRLIPQNDPDAPISLAVIEKASNMMML